MTRLQFGVGGDLAVGQFGVLVESNDSPFGDRRSVSFSVGVGVWVPETAEGVARSWHFDVRGGKKQRTS